MEVGPFSICGGTTFQSCFIGTRRILLACLDIGVYGKALMIVDFSTGEFPQLLKATG